MSVAATATEGVMLKLCFPDSAVLVLWAPICACRRNAARDDLLLRVARLVPAMFPRHASHVGL